MATTVIVHHTSRLSLRADPTTDPTGLDSLLRELGLATPFPYFEDADVLTRPLDIGRAYFADILAGLTGTGHDNAFKAMQWPNNLDNGDLAAILPKLVHGTDAESADALAVDLVNRFPVCSLFIRPFSIPGEVHLRVFFNKQTLSRLLLPYILDRGSRYGSNFQLARLPGTEQRRRKKVVVEFSSPNVADDFQGKHVRSTILGAQITRIYEAMGWDVVRLNYLGDWGKPIALLGIGWSRFGHEEQLDKRPIRHILEVKHRINAIFDREVTESKRARDEKRHEDQARIESEGLFAERNDFFKRLEQGDTTATAFWQRIRDSSIRNYKKLYERMNITFDEYSGESQVLPERIAEIEGILRSRGIAEESGGSLVIDLKKKAGMKTGMAIIRDRSGSTTYLLRDLAAAIERHKTFEFDEMLYVVASDHNDHFIRLKKILELLDMKELAEKLRHVSFSKTSNLSAELNGANTLRSILDRCQSAIRMSLDYHAEQKSALGQSDEALSSLAVNALLFEEARVKRATDDAFDQSRLTSFEAGTALSLQYCYYKLCSGLASPQETPGQIKDAVGSIQHDHSGALMRLLAMWPDVAHSAYQNLEPNVVVHYLSTVAVQLSNYLDVNPVPRVHERSFLEAVKIVLDNGFMVLGMRPPSLL